MREAVSNVIRHAGADRVDVSIQISTGTVRLALIDLTLPDGFGLDALRHFKRRSPQTVCVIVTVMGQDAHIVAALSAGAQGYLLRKNNLSRF